MVGGERARVDLDGLLDLDPRGRQLAELEQHRGQVVPGLLEIRVLVRKRARADREHLLEKLPCAGEVAERVQRRAEVLPHLLEIGVILGQRARADREHPLLQCPRAGEVAERGQRRGELRPRALQLLSHVVAAELLWLARLENRKPPLAVWPALTLAQCADHLKALPHKWQDLFADLAPDDLASAIDYVNSKGESFRSTIGDVLMHVVLHSAYHRGQIAADVRANGRDPAYTDFIHCVRNGWI